MNPTMTVDGITIVLTDVDRNTVLAHTSSVSVPIYGCIVDKGIGNSYGHCNVISHGWQITASAEMLESVHAGVWNCWSINS